MKLSGIYKDVATRVTTGITEDRLIDYINAITEDKEYKDLAVRVASGVESATFSPAEICEWYGKYDCHDSHIMTLFKKVIRENYPNAWKVIQDKMGR